MFELTLCLCFERQKYISLFYKTMLPVVKSDGGIIIKHNSNGKSYLSIALSETKKEYLKSKVLDFVTRVVEEDFKYNFFKTNIEAKASNNLTEAFFCAIASFDMDFDREIISSVLEFSNEIVIESLFYFKLQGLQKRWQKTADIINQNFIMDSENSMSEVLKYLCAVSENNSVLVDLNFTEKQIEVKNYLCKKRFKKDASGISKMFEEVIRLNPTKINIRNFDETNDQSEVTNVLLKVFNDKIYFV